MSSHGEGSGSGSPRHRGSSARTLLRAGAYVTMPVWASLVLLAGAHLTTSSSLPGAEPSRPSGEPAPEPDPAPVPDPDPERAPEPAPDSPPAPAPAPAPEPATSLEDKATIEELRSQLREAQSRARSAAADAAKEGKRRESSEEDLASAQAKLAEYEPRLKEAQDESAAARKRTQELEIALSHKSGPVGSWLQSFGNAHLAAALAGLFGLFTVLGPMTFVHVYKAVVGSALGGLMVGSCINYFTAPESDGWIDDAQLLLSGDGHSVEYFIWFAMIVAGVLRWYFGWEWVLYAVIDDVYMTRPMADAYMKTPLLSESFQPSASKHAEDDEALGYEHGGGHHADEEVYSLASEERGLDRLIQLVRRFGHEMHPDARASDDWFYHLWAEVADVLHMCDIGEDVVSVLVQHGFNPENPRVAQPPSLLHLHQALEEMRAAALPRQHVDDYRAVGHVAVDAV